MQKHYKTLFHLLTVIAVSLFLIGGLASPVKAATCTWNGSVNVDWTVPSNWSDCGGSVPGAADSVTIQDVANDPVIPAMTSVVVSTLTIQTGAQLVISAGSAVTASLLNNHGTLVANASSPVSLLGSGVFNNFGTVLKTGGDYFFINPFFNNYGTVDISEESVILDRGGTHVGTFQGNAGTTLFLGLESTNQTFQFETDSLITVPNVFLRGGIINFEGTYWPPATSSFLAVQPSSEHCTVTFASEASVVRMPETTWISNWGKFILEPRSGAIGFPRLDLYTGGEIQNLGDMTVQNAFYWRGGKISGAGTTNVLTGVTFSVNTSPHELDDQVLINSADANWTAGTITLSNGAEIDNQGTFNAAATTTMSGGSNGSFSNHGRFVKNGSGTITTIDVDFANDENIEVVAGTLTFTSGFTSGDGTVLDLGGGMIGAGEELTLVPGASLTGSGTLNGGLNNSGEVNPGDSPGKITVTEDFTQTAEGVLTIELGGTTPGSGYDQLVVNGSASPGGTLNVSLINGFVPSVGDQFTLLTYELHTGSFASVNLPDLPANLKWQAEYSDEGFILSVESEWMFVFLPLIWK